MVGCLIKGRYKFEFVLQQKVSHDLTKKITLKKSFAENIWALIFYVNLKALHLIRNNLLIKTSQLTWHTSLK